MQGSSTRGAAGAVLAAGLIAATAATACGESTRTVAPTTPIAFVDLAGEPVKSGARLRAVYWVSEEGLRVPTARFFDTQRGEECSFGRSARDALYCYPDATSSGAGFPLYDAECRTQVFADCQRYAISEVTAACETPTRSLHELADELDGEPLIGPDCQAPLVSTPGMRYRRLGASVPSTEFVRAVAGVSSFDGARLGLEQLSAEDGSAVALNFFDNAEELSCVDFSARRGDTHYCAPADVGSVDTYFEHEVCHTGGRRLAAGPCSIAMGYSFAQSLFYRLGSSTGVVPPFVVKEGRLDFCLMSTPGTSGYELGEAVPVNVFAPLETALMGNGRVKLGLRQSSDGRVVLPDTMSGPTAWLWDDELGVPCSITSVSDGEYRCIPSLDGRYAPGLYADERCAVPLAEQIRELADGEPNWLVDLSEPLAYGCPSPSSPVVYELADEPFLGALYLRSQDDDGNPRCEAYADTWPSPLFAPKETVPLSRFVGFEKQVE
jgi:hypothetical protein